MRIWMVFFSFCMGCGSPILPSTKGADTGDTEADDGWGSTTGSDADADADDGGDDGPAPLENPTIGLASAVCLDGTRAFWKLDVIATDPQGINTLTGEANCDIYPAGATEGMAHHSVSLTCASGDCGQTYDGEEEGVLCNDASNWEFRFTVTDEDGYVSAVEVVTGTAV